MTCIAGCGRRGTRQNTYSECASRTRTFALEKPTESTIPQVEMTERRRSGRNGGPGGEQPSVVDGIGVCTGYVSSSAAPKSILSLRFLLSFGAAGLAGYIYLAAAAPVKPKISDKGALDPQNFVDFKLKTLEPYNHNTAKYVHFRAPDTPSLLPVASCVIVKSTADAPNPLLDPKGKPVIRPYTPISPSDQPGELTFLVQKYEEGKMSKYMHEMKPGEKLSIKGPIPKFDFKINQFEEVGMIAGDPCALKDPSNKTCFTLIFANLSEKDILMKEEFDTLRKKYPKTLNVVYTVDKAEPGWQGPTGYENSELVKQHLPPANLGEKAKIFVAAVAGKKEGMKQGALAGILKDLWYTEDQVFKF
ncbi:hypothetical protein C8Q76DRAFT_809025 [Earliella scabrosa]|nr:hypothetical protein C8Q76DRAFT_809025 [Earliella scabrosa]